MQRGAIEDTAVQKAAITKALVRSEFKVVVTGGKAKGDTTAAALLDHSLQDHPSNLSYDEYTTYAKQIKQSTEFNTIVNNFKSYVTGRKLYQRVESGSTTLNSTEDLHLAYNKISYTILSVFNLSLFIGFFGCFHYLIAQSVYIVSYAFNV